MTYTNAPTIEVGARVRFDDCDLVVEIKQAQTYNHEPVYAVHAWVWSDAQDAWECAAGFTINRCTATWEAIKREAQKILALSEVERRIAREFPRANVKFAYSMVKREIAEDADGYYERLRCFAQHYVSCPACAGAAVLPNQKA